MTDLNDVLFLCQEPPVVDGGALRVGMRDGGIEVIREAPEIWEEKKQHSLWYTTELCKSIHVIHVLQQQSFYLAVLYGL